MAKRAHVVLVLFATLLLISIGLLAYPLLVIQPFRHQGETELKVALWIIRWRPYFEALAVICAMAALVWNWRMFVKRWSRGAACAATVIICAAAGLSQLNVYEIMFHRYDKPAFSRASDAGLDPDDKVLAIALNGAARAYPIRNIAYHHVINDEVGGLPVVATY